PAADDRENGERAGVAPGEYRVGRERPGRPGAGRVHGGVAASPAARLSAADESAAEAREGPRQGPQEARRRRGRRRLSTETIGGRYALDRPLGRGGMASVYLGHDGQLERRVAVKLLAPGVARDHDLRRRFARESRLAARLSHPNVVAVYDAGEEDGRPYIVMEYVEGETVADVLRRRGSLPPEEAVEIAAQVCAGLAHAHAHGLVHRDVKPQNLLVARDGRVKIADFGVARGDDASKLTQAGTVLGTAAYLSPEQAAGAEVGPCSDIYSVGAVLYELLSGSTPYRFESLAGLAAPRTAPPPLPPHVPPALAEVVARCLAPDPDDRPASAGELERDPRPTLDP